MIAWIHILLIEILERLGLGVKVKIKYSMKCNLKCTYCSVNIPKGKRAEFEELANDEWLLRIDNFPMKIRKIIIVGGEPFFRKDIIELVKELVKRKIVVKILTNLTYKRIHDLPKSPYVKLIATYHHGQYDTNYFIRQWKSYKGRIAVFEFGKSHIKGTKKMEFYEEEGYNYWRRDFIICPNGEYVMSLLDYYRMTGHHPKKKEEIHEASRNQL